jgi:hypothetical protein
MYEEYDPELYCKLFVDADDISKEDLQKLARKPLVSSWG